MFAFRGGQVVRKMINLLHKKCKLGGQVRGQRPKNAYVICEGSLRTRPRKKKRDTKPLLKLDLFDSDMDKNRHLSYFTAKVHLNHGQPTEFHEISASHRILYFYLFSTYTNSLVNATFGSEKKSCNLNFVLRKLSEISSYKME